MNYEKIADNQIDENLRALVFRKGNTYLVRLTHPREVDGEVKNKHLADVTVNING